MKKKKRQHRIKTPIYFFGEKIGEVILPPLLLNQSTRFELSPRFELVDEENWIHSKIFVIKSFNLSLKNAHDQK